MKKFIMGVLLFLTASVALPGTAWAAPRWYCSTTTTQGQACIPDTTMATTTTATTIATTTTATTIATTTTATTIATTTTASTVPVTNPQCSEGCETTTTAKQTTTTKPDCGLCAGQFGTTTTVPSTTSTTGSTTTTKVTDPGTLPPTARDAFVIEETPTSAAPQTLPVTGGGIGWLALFGVCLIALGGLFVLWKRA